MALVAQSGITASMVYIVYPTSEKNDDFVYRARSLQSSGSGMVTAYGITFGVVSHGFVNSSVAYETISQRVSRSAATGNFTHTLRAQASVYNVRQLATAASQTVLASQYEVVFPPSVNPTAAPTLQPTVVPTTQPTFKPTKSNKVVGVLTRSATIGVFTAVGIVLCALCGGIFYQQREGIAKIVEDRKTSKNPSLKKKRKAQGEQDVELGKVYGTAAGDDVHYDNTSNKSKLNAIKQISRSARPGRSTTREESPKQGRSESMN